MGWGATPARGPTPVAKLRGMRRAVFMFCVLVLSMFCVASPAHAAWLHGVDPFLVRFPDGLFIEGIRWYGLSYLAGFFVGWLLIRRVASAGVSTLDAKAAGDLVVTVAIGIVVGGRLGYVLFYAPGLITTTYDGLPYWGVLALDQGGMASHGGMLGGIAACLWFARRHKQSPLFLFDLMAFGAPLGLFFGRVANFINGELYGRPCAEGFALAVKFPQEMGEWPVEQIEPLIAQYNGTTGMIFLKGPYEFVQHMMVRIQSGDPQAAALIEPLLTPRHPSQLYAAALEGLAVAAVLIWLYRKPVRAGLVGGVFCMAYAAMRIVNEFFRMPDSHLLDREFAAVGITRGQWLSVLLFGLGVFVVVLALRLKTPAMGGWRRVNAQATGADGDPPDASD